MLAKGDETRHAIDAGDLFVNISEKPWWTDHPKWIEEKPLEGWFVYSSETNDVRLDGNGLAAILRLRFS